MGELQEVFVELGGQDDNVGDSVLRAAYLQALRGPQRRFHVFVGSQPTSDYLSGLPLTAEDVVYTRWKEWAAASAAATRPVHLLNAGEINPAGGVFPHVDRAVPLERAVAAGGLVVAAGIGLRKPEEAHTVVFTPAVREAALVSWRDRESQAGAGFGTAAPDWAFALGTATEDWPARAARPYLALTFRFDRPWPDASWLQAVRVVAARTETTIVTVAQVARDAPRAVRLAEELGGEFLLPESTSHADLDRHVRQVYRQSLAVISDRAHGLIIAASEGAYPIGSAHDPEKLTRMMAMAQLDDLVGRYDELAGFADRIEASLPRLAPGIDAARKDVAELAARIQGVLAAEQGVA